MALAIAAIDWDAPPGDMGEAGDQDELTISEQVLHAQTLDVSHVPYVQLR